MNLDKYIFLPEITDALIYHDGIIDILYIITFFSLIKIMKLTKLILISLLISY